MSEFIDLIVHQSQIQNMSFNVDQGLLIIDVRKANYSWN